MQKIEAIIRPEKLEEVKGSLAEAGFLGMYIVHITGRGAQKGIVHVGRGGEIYEVDMLNCLTLTVTEQEPVPH